MAEKPPLSRVYADFIDREVERLLEIQADDGSFHNGGVAYNYEQNLLYPLALAYLHPDGPYHQDARLLDAIARSGDYHARLMNTEGQWELTTPGGKWGWHIDEWRLHFWLETRLLLTTHLDAERLAYWDDALQRGAAGADALLRENHARGVIDFVEGEGFSSPNHMAWYCVVCRRAGLLYGREDWVKLAEALLEAMRSAQTADGFWVETSAPAVGYNYISLLAVSVCLEHLAPEKPSDWLAAIERGMDAQLHWAYPNGASIAEIDGRQRYHGRRETGQPVLTHILPAACAHWARGAAALRRSADSMRAHSSVGNFNLPFFCETARYLARHEQPDEAPERGETVWKARGFVGGWRKRLPWQSVLSGIVTRRYESRWRLDIANLIGLYHAKAELLAGGGHSKDDPQWATFTVRPTQDAEPLWLPDHAELIQDEAEDRLLLRYGGTPVEVGIALNAERVTVRFALSAPNDDCSAVARLLRPLPPGTELLGPDGQSLALDAEQRVDLSLEAGSEVRIEGVRYLLPPGGRFVWPLLPFNPYNQAGTSGAGDAFAAFEIPLNAARPTAMLHVTVPTA